VVTDRDKMQAHPLKAGGAVQPVTNVLQRLPRRR
jgi:hypothetical protein